MSIARRMLFGTDLYPDAVSALPGFESSRIHLKMKRLVEKPISEMNA